MGKFLHQAIKHIEDKEKIESILSESGNAELINEKDEHGDSLIHFAARAYNIPVMSVLKKYGADLEAVNEHGRRPIHEVIDSFECVEYLVNTCQVDVNAMKRGDWTPVMIAAMKGNLDIVRILVNAGAMLDRKTKDGRTPLYLAVQEGHMEVAKSLTDQFPQVITEATNSGRYPTQAAAALSDSKEKAFELTKYLLSHAVVPLDSLLLHRDNSGCNILLDAAASQNLELLKYLLEQGADASDSDSLGRSMLHHAAMMGNLNILEALIQIKGLDWNRQDTWDYWTPLMHAAKEGHLNIVKYLVETVHVDTQIKDKHGRTAKELAELWKRQDVVSCL